LERKSRLQKGSLSNLVKRILDSLFWKGEVAPGPGKGKNFREALKVGRVPLFYQRNNLQKNISTYSVCSITSLQGKGYKALLEKSSRKSLFTNRGWGSPKEHTHNRLMVEKKRESSPKKKGGLKRKGS